MQNPARSLVMPSPRRAAVILFYALRRVLLSLLSTILAIALLGAFVSLVSSIRHPVELDAFPILFCYFGILVISFGWPGWVLALPAVLLFTNLQGRRFWVLLALGVAIGPVTWYFRLYRGRYSFGSSDLLEFFFAALISGLSAYVYLSLLRRSQASEQSRDSMESGI